MKSKEIFQTSHIIINDHMYDLSDPNLEYLSQSIEMEYFLTKICKNLLDAYFSVSHLKVIMKQYINTNSYYTKSLFYHDISKLMTW